MPIKIIDETPSREVAKRCICSNCGITLEYVPNDTSEEIRRDYTGDGDTYRFLICPKCQHKIDVK